MLRSTRRYRRILLYNLCHRIRRFACHTLQRRDFKDKVAVVDDADDEAEVVVALTTVDNVEVVGEATPGAVVVLAEVAEVDVVVAALVGLAVVVAEDVADALDVDTDVVRFAA